MLCSAIPIAYRKKKMDSRFWWPILLAFAMASAGARSQSTDALGFLSIDCGREPGSSYVDTFTNISYVSDAGFIDTGVNRITSVAYAGKLRPPGFSTLRAFPNGTRNCYTIGSRAVERGSKYLLRAWFLYGNYDGLDGQPLSFDLHLGVNYWDRVNVTNAELLYLKEIIAVATAGYLSVCLVNTETGTPFISGLDLRLLKDNLYPAANEWRSLLLVHRWNLGVERYIRYPDDPIDRVWGWNRNISLSKNWNDSSTNSTVRNLPQDSFEVPSVVMQTAITPIDSSSLVIPCEPSPDHVNQNQFFPILHISEILDLSGTNQSRQFNIYVNGIRWPGNINIMTPPYLYSDAVYSLEPLPSSPIYSVSLEALSNSTLPPILNAFELFTAMSNTSVPSDAGDVDAMTSIKEWYRIQRNWMGDPCSPSAFVWDGLNCTHSLSNPPRVITLNLSSSGLTGEITKYVASLSALQYLDLSYNNLIGSIPDDLANLSSLKLLDLTGNKLNGTVPSNLLEMAQNGLLILRLDKNPHLCYTGTSCNRVILKVNICFSATGNLIDSKNC